MEEENVEKNVESNENEEVLAKKFIGKKSDEMYDKMQKNGSFNVFSFLFGMYYFLYRKMYLVTLLVFIVNCLLVNIFDNTIWLNIIAGIVYGFLFYPLYKMHINRKIEKLNNGELTEEDFIRKGGTSIAPVIIILVVVILLSLLLLVRSWNNYFQ